ncbi:hypothetical protein ACFFVJ_13815 [Roseibium salinum]|uniref:hypothetical protein n=1 Tax=Roseibium salinum TaxID=1604349 RepID=UPI0035E5D804
MLVESQNASILRDIGCCVRQDLQQGNVKNRDRIIFRTTGSFPPAADKPMADLHQTALSKKDQNGANSNTNGAVAKNQINNTVYFVNSGTTNYPQILGFLWLIRYLLEYIKFK